MLGRMTHSAACSTNINSLEGDTEDAFEEVPRYVTCLPWNKTNLRWAQGKSKGNNKKRIYTLNI